MGENFCIAAFASRLQVMAFEELLKQKGMKASIVTTPRAVALGCGLSVRFEEKDAPRVKALYQALGLGNLIGFLLNTGHPIIQSCNFSCNSFSCLNNATGEFIFSVYSSAHFSTDFIFRLTNT